MKNNAVLLSIQPKWCELIASGKKTVEVRKTRPKIETPFKCYIYCTKQGNLFSHGGIVEKEYLFKNPDTGIIKFDYPFELMDCGKEYTEDNFLSGKVIGEFICDDINTTDVVPGNEEMSWFVNNMHAVSGSCLNEHDILNYCHKDATIYGWHISDLVIYDKPKELGEFYRDCEEPDCDDCPNLHFENTPSCYEGWCVFDEKIPIKRPPQNWCYVKEASNEIQN